MSGHSKWATIKRKIIKEITISSRDGGGDPDANPRLRLAIQTAKGSNMPQDNITRAIKKGTGELEGVKYEEITYEAYAPHGIAMIIESVTDNKNRTVAELRHSISKANGNLGESGSVAWMFERKGVINVEKENTKEDDLMDVILDAGADDLNSDGDYYEVTSSLENFEKVRKAIEEKSYKIESASLQYLAKDLLPVEGKNVDAVIRCIEAVEDNDDVQNVYSNADFPDE